MDERRLVGMSNSARKRAARIFHHLGGVPGVPRHRRVALYAWHRIGLTNTLRYAEARKRYRVGERLSWDLLRGGLVRK